MTHAVINKAGTGQPTNQQTTNGADLIKMIGSAERAVAVEWSGVSRPVHCWPAQWLVYKALYRHPLSCVLCHCCVPRLAKVGWLNRPLGTALASWWCDPR